jgi:hypothetical protein
MKLSLNTRNLLAVNKKQVSVLSASDNTEERAGSDSTLGKSNVGLIDSSSPKPVRPLLPN